MTRIVREWVYPLLLITAGGLGLGLVHAALVLLTRTN